MNDNNRYVVGLVTAKDKEEAHKIAQGLLDKKLAACVNVIDSVESMFWWQGKMDQAREVLLVMKTRGDVMEEVIRTVKSLHSYDTPEIIAFPIVAGSKDYLDWIDSSVR